MSSNARPVAITPGYLVVIALIAGSLLLAGLAALLGWGPVVLWIAVAGECVGWVLLAIKASRDRRRSSAPPSQKDDGQPGMRTYFGIWAPATIFLAGLVIVGFDLSHGISDRDIFGASMGAVVVLIGAGLFVAMRIIHRSRQGS